MDVGHFSFFRDEIDNCLTCNKQISKFTFATNNGVCDDCPRLTHIAPQFWKVIYHLAEQGWFDAIKTIELYG
jgi:hypothetical protein